MLKMTLKTDRFAGIGLRSRGDFFFGVSASVAGKSEMPIPTQNGAENDSEFGVAASAD